MSDIILNIDTNTEWNEGTLTDVEAVDDSLQLVQLANNYALSFDGVDDYVALPDGMFSGLFDGSKSFTIETNIETNSFPSDNTPGNAKTYFSPRNENELFLQLGDNGPIDKFGLRCEFSVSGWTTVLTSDVININQKYHLVISYDPADGYIMYLDGNQVDTNPIIEGIVASSGINMICGYGSTDKKFWDGFGNETRIWNTARTQTEIQDNMNTVLTGDETGLVSYYKFDEGTGTTLYDSAGSNDGTIYGASWVDDLTRYLETGNRISPPIDLSGISFVGSSTISWNEILNSQTIDIETSVDNKATWQTATNGGSIADIQGADTLDVRQTLSTTDTTVTPVLDSLNIIIEEGEEYYITGTVEEDGVFVERTVRLYKRSTGELVDEGISDSVDGGFSFIIPDQTEHYVVALDDISDATDYNALIYDRVIPFKDNV